MNVIRVVFGIPFLMLALAPTKVVLVNARGRIVGGNTVTNINEYPFYAYPSNGYLCGASLIHDDILISAAHCGDKTWKDGLFLGGNRYVAQYSNFYTVNKTIIHPSYDVPRFNNDLMLIKINGLRSSVPFAQLNSVSHLPTNGQELTAIGYGRTSDGGPISYDLMQVNFKTISYEECAQVYGSGIINSTMVCSGIKEGGKDTCQGDSGGPIFINGTKTIIGLVAFGEGCAQVGVPSVNTRISHFHKWIQDSICTLSSKPPSTCFAPVPVPVPIAVPISRPVTVPTPVSKPVTVPTPVAVRIPVPTATCIPKGGKCKANSSCCGVNPLCVKRGFVMKCN